MSDSETRATREVIAQFSPSLAEVYRKIDCALGHGGSVTDEQSVQLSKAECALLMSVIERVLYR